VHLMKRGEIVLKHICENCGKEEVLSAQEAYYKGWNYPPIMGCFKSVSPRTCENCGIKTTLWWELKVNKRPVEQLSEKYLQTLKRIWGEPESALP